MNQLYTKKSYHCYSGGATELPALAGAAKALAMHADKPDVIIGISSGAILSLFAAMQYHPEYKEEVTKLIKDLSTNISPKIIWGRRPPITSKGNISVWAIGRMIVGRPALGKFRNLHSYYTEIARKYYNIYKKDKGTYRLPHISVVYVTRSEAKRVEVSPFNGDFEQWVDAVIASASVPLATGPVESNDGYDGGLRNHNPSGVIIDKGAKISHLTEIYSRERNSYKDVMFSKGKRRWWKEIAYLIQVSMIETSKKDQEKAEHYCKANNIPHRQIFTGNNMRSMFDTNKFRLERAYNNGFKKAKSTLKNEI